MNQLYTAETLSEKNVAGTLATGTTASVAKTPILYKFKYQYMKTGFTRLMAVVFIAVSVFISSSLKAQTITFTGTTTDFTGQGISALAAGSGDVTYYASTNGTFMYFGAFRTNGQTWGSTDHFTVYIDADPRSSAAGAGNGSTVGLAWDNQTPTMPFRADYRIAVRNDGATGSGSGSSFYSSNNTTTNTPTWTTGSANAKGYTQYVSNASNGGIEIRVPLSDFGNPASAYVSMFATYPGAGGGFFGPATGTFTGSSLSGYIRNLGVYKTTGNLTAGAATTPITDVSVASGTGITGGDYGDITITSGSSTSTITANTSFTGTLTIGTAGTGVNPKLGLSTFSLFIGGRGFGGSAGTLVINGGSGTPIQNSTTTIAFLGNGLVNGNNTLNRPIGQTGATVTIAGNVDFTGGSGVTTFPSGTILQVNNGGSVSNPATYAVGSTLVYNTGTTYTANGEWTPNVVSGAGYPDKVTVQGNTTLNFGSSAQFRQNSGNFSIVSGSTFTLSSASGGDYRFAGGASSTFTNSGTFNTNGRAFWWVGSGTATYTKTGGGTDNIDIFIHNSASTLNLAASPNATNWSLVSTGTTTASALQFQSSGSLYLDANTLTIPNNGTIYVTGASSTIGGNSVATPGIISFAGIGNVTPVTSGTSTITCTGSTRVQTASQLKVGGTATTPALSITGVFRLNQGGYVDNTLQPIKYNAGSTLEYNHTSGIYGVQATEWPATNSPSNVTVYNNGGTGIDFGTNNITARTLTGTLTVQANQNLNLNGGGTPNIITLNTVTGSGATISGTGTYTHSASGSFTTAHTGGINGTITTIGALTLPATTSFTFNGSASQVTGTNLPATVAALTINNTAGGTNGVTISNNTLVISGATTLTAGALILPTGVSNLVTFTGTLGGTSGTLTGSSTSNIVTGALSGTFNLAFTAGGTALNNWNKGTSTFGSSITNGLASVVSISGTFTQASTGDFWTTSTGGLTILNGGTYDEQANGWYLGSGALTLNSGSTIKINDAGGLNATSTSAGLVRASGTRTFSGGANYVFNSSSAQAIGDALDATVATGKTGPITGTITNANSNATSGLTLNAGTTITINTPGAFNIGVTATSSSILTAPATSVINGTGTVNMFGNGATNGSTLITANASGVNGTFATTNTSLSNGANNNTNFTFNGAVAQTTGALLPAIINNLVLSNSFAGSVATPSVILSSSITVNGTTTFGGGGSGLIGLVGIGASNTLTLNGSVVYTNGSKLVGTTTSNLIIGGSGAIPATTLFASTGGLLNNFTMNRTGVTVTIGQPLTVSGTYSATAGVIAMSNNTLTLNGNIALGAATLTATGPLTIGGSGTITGSLLGTSNPLALTTLTMNRASATLPLGSNVTVSNATGLTLTAGYISLGIFNLTSTSTGANSNLGSGSTSSHIIATNTGQAFNTIAATNFNAQTFPIGDGTNYTPVILTFSATSATGTVGVKTTASASGNINTGSTPSVYISRYWTFTNTLGATYAYSGTFRYISPGDVTGTESNLKLSRWNGSAWTEFSGSSVSSPVLSSGSLTQTTGPLSNEFTGRTNVSAINYVWNGTTNDWNTGTNWSPNGVPTALDNVTIDGTSSVLCSINSSSYTVNNFTLNGTGTFAMAASTSLTINGNVTYGGSATASFDCSSTLNIASTISQTVPALDYGNLNLTGAARVLSGAIGICGTFTPGGGGFTVAGSTINFNGAGSQTIPAFTYNNLSSSNSGARTLVNGGTITVGGTFTPGSNTYTNTGNTFVFNATSGTVNVILPPVSSGNSFNILTINGTGGTFALPYSASTQNLATTLNVTAGTFVLNPSSSSLANTVAVGTININGGTLDDQAVITGLSTTLQVTTAWNQTSGVVTNTSANGTDKIQFTGGGATTFSGLTAPASFQYFSVQVSNNTTLTLSSNLAINGLNGPSVFLVDAGTPGSTCNAGAFVISNGATFVAGNGFTVNGIFKTANTVGLSGSTTTAFNTVTNTPALTLGAASTVEYSSTGTATITGRSDYANLTVSAAGTFSFGASATLSANYSQTAGTVTLTSGASARTLTVGGTFTQSAGTFNVTGSSATAGATVTVSGATSVFSVIMSPNTSNAASLLLPTPTNTILFQANGNATFTGTSTTASLDWMTGGTSGSRYDITFGIKGNFNWSGTGKPYTSGSGTAKGFTFNGTAPVSSPQTITYSGATSDYGHIFVVNSGTAVKLLTGIAIGPNTNPYNTFTVNGTLDASTFVVSGGSATVNANNTGFSLASGANLITANATGVAGSVTTSIKNFSSAANYEFQGAATGTFTTTPATLTVNGFTVNKSSGAVLLNQAFTVNGDLTFTSGNLDLNGSNNITLGASSTIQTETNAKAVINNGTPGAGNGWIGTSRTINAPSASNIANLGATLTTASNLGTTFIKRFPKAISSVGTGNSIARYYSIAPTSTGASATITLSYFDNELNGNTEAPPMVQYSSTTAGSGYTLLGSTAADATANTVTFSPTSISTTPTFYTLASTGLYYTTATGDVSTGATWIGGVVPVTNSKVQILHDVALSANFAFNDMFIQTAKAVTIGSNTLTINGAVTGSGTLTGSATSILNINGAATTVNFTAGSTNNYLKDLNIGASGSMTIGSNGLNITAGATPGTVTITSGGILATTSGNLTLKSDASGTARVAAGNSAGGYITGSNVTVERYIKLGSTTPPRTGKAWRLLTAPVSGTTVNAAWQQGMVYNGTTGLHYVTGSGNATTATPTSGYGTLITGGTAQSAQATANGNGFDWWSAIASSTSSIRYHNGLSTGAWLTPTTTTGLTFTNNEGYLTFIRGDRSISTTGVGATTLRATGALKQGDKSIAIIPNGTSTFTLVGNPFASPIDFDKILPANSSIILNRFTIWDANLNTTGGYRLVTRTGANTYSVTPPGGPANPGYIQSGQAVFVEASTNSANNLTIAESDKVGSGNDDVFFQGGDNTGTLDMATAKGRAGEASLNINLNIKNADNSILLADGALLTIGARYNKSVTSEDARKANNFSENLAIAVDTFNLISERRPALGKVDTVFLKLWGTGIKNYQFDIWSSVLKGRTANLVDKYLGTSTPLNLDGSVNSIGFSITSDVASKDINRFYIVTPGTGAAIIAGDNTGVEYAVTKGSVDMKAYPNPATGSRVNVLMSNLPKGIYELSAFTLKGTKMLTRKIEHTGGDLTESITLANWSAGVYTLQLTDADGKIVKTVSVVVSR